VVGMRVREQHRVQGLTEPFERLAHPVLSETVGSESMATTAAAVSTRYALHSEDEIGRRSVRNEPARDSRRGDLGSSGQRTLGH
jgi:hypothetical protein